MQRMTVAELGDHYGLDEEARVRDGVRLVWCGVARGKDKRGRQLPTVERRVNGLKFWSARVAVWHNTNGMRRRVMQLEHGVGGLWVLGQQDAWPVTLDDVVEIERAAPRPDGFTP